MTQSILGANAAIRYLKAYQAHVDYWKQLNPAFQLAYIDNPEHTVYIEQYSQALPNSMIVARIYHPLDGGFHLAPTGTGDTRHYVSSPTEYLSAYGWLGRKKNIILNVMNEPSGFESDANLTRLVQWMLEFIPMAAQSETKCVLFNWAARNPAVAAGLWDGRYNDVLKLMAQYPDLFYMGLHIYGPNNLTGVLDAYVKQCSLLHINPPKVIASEFGIDSIGGTQRGYKTWPEYKDTYAQWQETQIKGILAPFIRSGVLVGLTTFQEGDSGGWADFDTENDSAYKAEIKRAIFAGELSNAMVLPPPVQPATVTVSLTVLTALRDSLQSELNVVDQLIKSAK